MNTHNLCFREGIRKIFSSYLLLSGAMSRSRVKRKKDDFGIQKQSLEQRLHEECIACQADIRHKMILTGDKIRFHKIFIKIVYRKHLFDRQTIT